MTDEEAIARDDHSRLAIAMDPDDVFEIISNSRRRQVILAVDMSAQPMTVKDLTQEIAAIENGSHPSQLTGQQRASVYSPLVQTHMCKLVDAGAVEYDGRSKQVRASPATAPLAKHIQTIETACFQPDQDGDDP